MGSTSIAVAIVKKYVISVVAENILAYKVEFEGITVIKTGEKITFNW